MPPNPKEEGIKSLLRFFYLLVVYNIPRGGCAADNIVNNISNNTQWNIVDKQRAGKYFKIVLDSARPCE